MIELLVLAATLNWIAGPGGQDGYLLHKSSDGGNYQHLEQLPANAVTYVDPDGNLATDIYRLAAFRYGCCLPSGGGLDQDGRCNSSGEYPETCYSTWIYSTAVPPPPPALPSQRTILGWLEAVPPPPPPPPTDAIGQWLLNEGSGNAVSDASANNNDGVLSGAYAWQANNLNFSAGTVTVSPADTLEITGSQSISAKITPNSVSGEQTIVYKGASAYNYWLTLVNDELQWSWSGGCCFHTSSSANLVQGTQYSVASVFDDPGDEVRLYVNGVQVYSRTISGGVDVVDGDFYIGSKRGTSSYFDGIISDVRVYDRALTQQEIEDL